MNFRKSQLALYAAALLIGSGTCTAEIAIVVNPANGAVMSEDDINGIFLAKMNSFPGGGSAIPLNQAPDSTSTQTFNQKVVKKTAQQLKAYWSKLVFTGQGTPPKEVADDQAVIKLISENPNTIGYIDSASVNASVKVVGTF